MGEATVFIGLPVYNGERFLAQAIDSLQAQTHTRWQLLISDNASTDRTEEICRDYADSDDRITYHRQPTNLGANANFDFVLSKAEGDHFMWAAADDEWESAFIEACVNKLAENPEAGFAFTDMVNIDSRSEIIRAYPPFSRFTTTTRRRDVRNYLRDFEIGGKYNLIYSLFRRDFIQQTWPLFRSIWHDPQWATAGADMGCVMGFICRRPVAIVSRVLFRKRTISDRDGKEQYHMHLDKYRWAMPAPLYSTYCRYLVEATAGTEFTRLARFQTTKLRWQFKIYRALKRKN